MSNNWYFREELPALITNTFIKRLFLSFSLDNNIDLE